MPRTRIFRSGDSQAVRIPAELAYADSSIDLEIRRLGDVITIFPARRNLRDVCEALLAMPAPLEIERREPIAVRARARG
jgi:antitoxin VapB